MAKVWNTKNNTAWKTKKNTVFASDKNTSWLGKLIGSMWDSIIYTWDSLLCTWDGIGKNDWYTDNPKNYYTKQ